jgi:hypothetical protein
LAGDQLFGDLQRHTRHVGEKPASGQTDSQKTSPRAVADYALKDAHPMRRVRKKSQGGCEEL